MTDPQHYNDYDEPTEAPFSGRAIIEFVLVLAMCFASVWFLVSLCSSLSR